MFCEHHLQGGLLARREAVQLIGQPLRVRVITSGAREVASVIH